MALIKPQGPTTLRPLADMIVAEFVLGLGWHQSPHSGIQSLKGKERWYEDFEESLDGDKSKERKIPLKDYEKIETDEDNILSLEAWFQGFALTVKSSKTNRNVYLRCSQGAVKLSKARSAERISSSRRTGCRY
ncbi:hypothetical protein PPACK8108_LOCUS14940 [Phakopsora pachyrhizi]|uniref:Uncharacterized protein n=1 Tax=Phakopsora pachyrhizi TaxID=170000 RepID=A0AAV0B803_PHAPC|nr:hypothetical protein PPACK8108_LOCUS14940 [Phakopsora pachyrhizi]